MKNSLDIITLSSESETEEIAVTPRASPENATFNSKQACSSPRTPTARKDDFCKYLQLGTRRQTRSRSSENMRKLRSGLKPKISPNSHRLERTFRHMDIDNLYNDFTEFERVVEKAIDFPTLDSFEEIDKRLDKFEKFIRGKRKESNGFVMPRPPKVPRRHFDDSIKEIVDEVLGKRTETSPSRNNFEVVSFETSDDDIDLQNFVDDMLHLDKMSEEHRRNVIESRILSSTSITNLVTNIIQKKNNVENVQKAYQIFNELSHGKENGVEESPPTKTNDNSCCRNASDTEETPKESTKSNDKSSQTVETSTSENVEENQTEVDIKYNVHDIITFEHDYMAKACEEDEDDDDCESLQAEPINLPLIPVRQVVTKSLVTSLTLPKRKKLSYCTQTVSDTNYCIKIDNSNGPVWKAFYQDFNLVIVQSKCISFWMQSPLGNIMGAQNLYIPKGSVQRSSLNTAYKQKLTLDMVLTTKTSVACIELWTKEHKSDYREVPLADVFANVYFWRQGASGIEKKTLQLENITGITDDVQYVVMKSMLKIIVSWYWTKGNEKKSKVHCYHLADDFQTVVSISEIQEVEHYISSLHNIEDCDDLVMGCGQNRITLWNVDFGYIVATIQLTNMGPLLSTHWVKCDRGFVFAVHHCADFELKLIAINGMNKSWKILQNFKSPSNYRGPKGAHVANGYLVAFYAQGALCWDIESGHLLLESPADGAVSVQCGKYVMLINKEQVSIRDSLSQLLAAEEI